MHQSLPTFRNPSGRPLPTISPTTLEAEQIPLGGFYSQALPTRSHRRRAFDVSTTSIETYLSADFSHFESGMGMASIVECGETLPLIGARLY